MALCLRRGGTISMEFDMSVDFGHLKRSRWQKCEPEVDLRCRGRHVEKSIWRHICATDGPISMTFWYADDERLSSYFDYFKSISEREFIL